jgi:hypothetical protein
MAPLHRISRQGMRVSRVGVEVDAILCSRYFPSPNHPLVIRKKHVLRAISCFMSRAVSGLSDVRRRTFHTFAYYEVNP